MHTRQYRQGDVFVREVESIPATAKRQRRDKGRVVLAYGEVTGHAHALTGPKVALFMDTGAGSGSAGGGRTYLEVRGTAPAALSHEEHTAIPIAPGTYEVIRQREYAPGEIRRVAD